MRLFRRILSRVRAKLSPRPIDNPTVTDYWTRHNVTFHHAISSRLDSIEYMNWRNWQYQFYEELMPCNGHDGRVILDYGCGPGHDVVGFVERSRPRQVIGMDVSPSALEKAEKRLAFHGSSSVKLVLIGENDGGLPLEDKSVDYIHSSGVLHHVESLEPVLREFGRVLKPKGSARIMVYNYRSLWLHLYVAYSLRIVKGIDSDVPLPEAFKRSTDGRECPISRCYRKEDFLKVSSACGFRGSFLGAAISMHEMSLLATRYRAIQDRRLPEEHRAFLRELKFDEFGCPRYRGDVAGIDGVYELRPES